MPEHPAGLIELTDGHLGDAAAAVKDGPTACGGKERFRQTALDGIAYERTLFLPQAGNWPDLRKLDLPEQTDNNENDQIGHIVARISGFDCVIDPLCDIHLGKAVDVMNYGARYVTCGFYDQYSSLIGKDTHYTGKSLREIMTVCMLKNLHIP